MKNDTSFDRTADLLLLFFLGAAPLLYMCFIFLAAWLWPALYFAELCVWPILWGLVSYAICSPSRSLWRTAALVHLIPLGMELLVLLKPLLEGSAAGGLLIGLAEIYCFPTFILSVLPPLTVEAAELLFLPVLLGMFLLGGWLRRLREKRKHAAEREDPAGRSE